MNTKQTVTADVYTERNSSMVNLLIYNYSDCDTHNEISEDGGIFVWKVCMDNYDPDDLNIDILSTDEREKFAQFTSPQRRLTYGLGHCALRTLLGLCAGIEPASVLLEINSHGKLLWSAANEQPPVYFNISHSGERIAIAVSREHPLGIDIERVRPQKRQEKILERVCAPEEIAQYENAVPPERESLFWQLWTAKEAVLKGVGDGFFRPADSFSVRAADMLTPDGAAVQSEDKVFDGWHVREVPLAEGYVCSLAYR